MGMSLCVGGGGGRWAARWGMAGGWGVEGEEGREGKEHRTRSGLLLLTLKCQQQWPSGLPPAERPPLPLL